MDFFTYPLSLKEFKQLAKQKIYPAFPNVWHTIDDMIVEED